MSNKRQRQQNKSKHLAVIEPSKVTRQDGFINTFLGSGLPQTDPMRNYKYMLTESDLITTDVAGMLYIGNKLAYNIVAKPMQQAVKRWVEIEDDEEDAFERACEDLGVEKAFCEAGEWMRLYGGSGIFMLIDDGGELTDPVNVNNIRSVEALRVFDRTEIYWDFSMLYADPMNKMYGKPEYYRIQPLYSMPFVVHESRMLIFVNDELPNRYKMKNWFWGMSSLQGLLDSVQQYDHVKDMIDLAIERFAQAVHKIPGLTDLMSTDDGEGIVIKRLQLLDMARSFRNTIAIDGEEDFKVDSLTLGGLDVLWDRFAIDISAKTSIPLAILFGRSPAGMNATGESDLTGWYDLVKGIQKTKLKPNLQKFIRLLTMAKESPMYGFKDTDRMVKFRPLDVPTEKEEAEIGKIKADTAKVKADERKIYVDMNALHESEIRQMLEDEEYPIDHSFDDELEEEPVLPNEMMLGERAEVLPNENNTQS